MNLETRLQAFVKLGQDLSTITSEQVQELAYKAGNDNPWFDERNVSSALNGIIKQLDKENLQEWLFVYDLENITPKKIGVMMAGNIPFAGFTDFLCILITGHYLHAKLNKEDSFLMQLLAQRLIQIEPEFATRIQFVPLLKAVDALIASGNDNTVRNLEQYFSNKPYIIRRTRTSLGILTGKETTEELKALGNDIFVYYGLSSRNVAKVLVPAGYVFNHFFETNESFHTILDHHRYQNNYDYNKSLLLVNRVPHFDNGFLLVTPSEQFISPISVLFYQEYQNPEDLNKLIAANQEETHNLVAADGWYNKSVPFGQAHYPAVWDNTDGVDTIEFLAAL